MFVVLQNAISLAFGDETKMLWAGGVESVRVCGALITPVQIAIVVANLAMCVSVWVAFRFTAFGRAIRAVADDVELSRIMGVKVSRVVVIVFAAGSAIAGVAAILSSLDTDMRPSMGFDALLMGVVAAIIGGIGSTPGTFLGGLFLGIVQQLGVWKLPTAWQDGIAFSVLILFLIFRPQGVFGLPIRRTSV
jgi:branched-subunit amino acid ABC-type transport system permease component